MTESRATIVNWYGPYTGSSYGEMLKMARDAAAKEWRGGGLYAAVGTRGVRGRKRLQYVGVSKSLKSRLGASHHKLVDLDPAELWLGEVDVPGIPGRRLKTTDPHLDYAEWMTAYFLEVPSNEKKRVNPPPMSAVLVNRWWAKDFLTPMASPSATWIDIVEWDAYLGRANLVRFGPRPMVKPKHFG